MNNKTMDFDGPMVLWKSSQQCLNHNWRYALYLILLPFFEKLKIPINGKDVFRNTYNIILSLEDENPRDLDFMNIYRYI
jgi:hypothetical protein